VRIPVQPEERGFTADCQETVQKFGKVLGKNQPDIGEIMT